MLLWQNAWDWVVHKEQGSIWLSQRWRLEVEEIGVVSDGAFVLYHSVTENKRAGEQEMQSASSFETQTHDSSHLRWH